MLSHGQGPVLRGQGHPPLQMAFSRLRRENFTAADGLRVGGGLGRSKLEVRRGALLGGEGRGAVVKTVGSSASQREQRGPPSLPYRPGASKDTRGSITGWGGLDGSLHLQRGSEGAAISPRWGWSTLASAPPACLLVRVPRNDVCLIPHTLLQKYSPQPEGASSLCSLPHPSAPHPQLPKNWVSFGPLLLQRRLRPSTAHTQGPAA